MLAGATLLDYRTAIQVKGFGTDTVPAQTAAVNSVRRRILGMRRWPFLEKQVTFTTVAGTPSVALTTNDLLAVNSVRLELGAAYYDLDYDEPEVLRRKRFVDRVTGTPLRWTRVAGALEFYPVPDQAYTVTVDYTYSPTVALVGDGDVDVIPSVYQDVITWGAIEELAYRERDWNQASFAHQQYGDRLKEMIGQYALEQRQTARQVEQWSGWSDVER